MQVSTRTATLILFTVPAVWSVNYLAARLAPGVVSPHVLAFLRWLIAAGILGFLAREELSSKRALILKDGWHHLALGALGMWICGAWLYFAGRTTPAVTISLIYSLAPVFIVIASALWLHEPLRKPQILGLTLALIGLVHIVMKGDWSALARLQFVEGDLVVVVCAIAWALYSIMLKRWPSDFSPIARLVLIALGGCVVMIPGVLVELMSNHPVAQTQWGWRAIGLILAVAIFPGAIAYLAYSVVQAKLGAAKTSMTLYLGPVYGAIAAWIVLGEPVHLYHFIGAALILPGIYLSSR